MARRPTSPSQSGGRKGSHLSTALASREISKILSTALDQVEEARREEYRLEANRTRAEAEAVADDLKRLIEKHGDDHPRVRKMQSLRSALERQAQLAESVVRRIETVERPAFGGWTATGRVWEANGAALAEVEVGFMSPEGSQANLEPTKTDGEGEFYATYPPDVVKRLIESKAQLSLVVRKGRTVIYHDPERFTVLPNAVRQFRVKIEKTSDRGKG